MTAQRAFRQEAADPKPMTRPELEAAAARHGVTVSPSMTDRAIHEAIASKLLPGAFNFEAPRGPAYAERACELALAEADRDAATAAATTALSTSPAATEAPSLRTLNGSGASHQDAAPSLGDIISGNAARERMIADMIRNGQR